MFCGIKLSFVVNGFGAPPPFGGGDARCIFGLYVSPLGVVKTDCVCGFGGF